MKIKVLYFSQIKDLVGKSEEVIEFSGETLKDLIDALSDRYPNVKDVLSRSMFAVNENYEKLDFILKDNDTVAIIPPVSGG